MGHIQNSLTRAKYSQINLMDLRDTTTGAVGRPTQKQKHMTSRKRLRWLGFLGIQKRRVNLLLPTITRSENTEGMDPDSYQRCTAKG